MGCETKNILDDVENKFSNCCVVSLRARFSNDDPYGVAYNEDGTGENGIYRQMLASPEHFGIVISNELWAMSNGYKRAALLFALDLLPEGINRIICIKSLGDSPSYFYALAEAGVTFLIDDSGACPFETAIPKDAFSRCDENSQFWKTASDDAKKYVSFWSEHQKDIAIGKLLEEAFDTEGGRWECTDSAISPLVEAVTFGAMKYEPVFRDGISLIPAWADRLAQQYLFADGESYTNKFEQDLKTLGDIVSIWVSRLKEASFAFQPHLGVNKQTCCVLADIGRALGIDSDVEAYFAGVPSTDILAG